MSSPAFASNSSEVVRAELQTDGQLFAYIDFERGWGRIGEELDAALAGVTAHPLRVADCLDQLGLSQIRAVGLSSKAVPGGYDNRIFIHMPEGRRGLFAVFPDEPAPFSGLALAPADADLFAEVRIDLAAVIQTAKGAAQTLMADSNDLAIVQAALDGVEEPLRSALNYRGSIVAIVRLSKVSDADGAGASPPDYFVRIDSLAALAKPMLEALDDVETLEHDGLPTFKTTDGLIVAFDGNALLSASSLSFLDECRNRKHGLDEAPLVKDLLAGTSAVGHSLVYTSQHLLDTVRDSSALLSMLPGTPMDGLSFSDRFALTQALGAMPRATGPNAMVVVARQDGVLVRDRSVTSNKVTLPVVAALTPDFLGEFAVQAARTFSAFTAAERAKTATLAALAPGLDACAAAARTYFDTHEDEDSVSLSTLRGQPGSSLPDLDAAIEGDPEFLRHSDQITMQHREHGELVHVITLTADQRAAIEANLRTVDAAAAEYCVREDTTSVYGSSLFDADTSSAPATVVGEDYTNIYLDATSEAVSITTPGGQEVSIPRDTSLPLKARRGIAERRLAIEQNLARIDAAALAWLQSHPDEYSVGSSSLFEEAVLTAPEPVAGEDYSSLYLSVSSNELSIDSPTAGTVTYTRPLDAAVEQAVRGRLEQIAELAAGWFAGNPDEALVLAAELLAPEDLVVRAGETSPEEEASAINVSPSLEALVIRRTDTLIRVKVDGERSIEVPLRR